MSEKEEKTMEEKAVENYAEATKKKRKSGSTDQMVSAYEKSA